MSEQKIQMYEIAFNRTDFLKLVWCMAFLKEMRMCNFHLTFKLLKGSFMSVIYMAKSIWLLLAASPSKKFSQDYKCGKARGLPSKTQGNCSTGIGFVLGTVTWNLHALCVWASSTWEVLISSLFYIAWKGSSEWDLWKLILNFIVCIL